MSKVKSKLERSILDEKCPNTEFFWPVFSGIRNEYGDLRSKSPYSVRIQENMDQQKLRIWTHFTQWYTIKANKNHSSLLCDYL